MVGLDKKAQGNQTARQKVVPGLETALVIFKVDAAKVFVEIFCQLVEAMLVELCRT
jgi:hypothetical protein